MFCSNCGFEISDGQKFCRSCGSSFQSMIKMLDCRLPDDKEAKFNNQQIKGMRSGVVLVMTGLMIGCFILIAAGLKSFYPIAAELIPIIVGIAGLFLFGGATILIYNSLSAGKESGGSIFQRESLSAKETNELPAPDLRHDIPNVTEVTTRQLDARIQKSN